ncbi:sensor histidine kinase [Nocardia cyriacigeorgica]|uniref:sensor histidine kinase n=1 Tax=Nocardia cyriacigeorgica TaxID=135487 RepID=UPI0013D4DEED|nr:sensor histidine kinase [Nocardia cyriacigeorgica]MBF6436270.1 sensor histidine kinase [Nocardia cyriacigeorgica]MBF6456744.1 sensor histidine kinase [Nocardia cyriacigeorgica]MBF6481563.1 sensor histidine kinase [Nocardia cyriacigeorgica]MBF6551549.1 sensor histidine kinase [Nocardia cyriacigeorgica]NEW30243.1 sensor histidine kinase [Nocardia cyriacigeorgica]
MTDPTVATTDLSTPAARRRARLRQLNARMWFDLFTVLAAVVLFTVAWPTLHLTHDVPAAVQPFLAALAAFPVLLVRLNPSLGWAISAGSALVIALAIPHTPGNDIPFQVVHIITLHVLLFAVALRAPVPMIVVVWGATSLLLGTTMAGDSAFSESVWAWPVSFGAIVLFALLIRWLVQSRQLLTQQEEANELERARRAILEEKARIARDLHDVVAHHMSLVVVQAQTAPYRVEGVTPAARAEFESIGSTAREALNEIRGMLGVLRSDGQLPEHAPQPTAADVETLFLGASRAGVAIDWNVDGPLSAVSDTTGLALYRIVQESLSNASRHAPGAAVHVRITVSADVEIVVSNDPGATAARPVGNGGHGITGMRARALAAGGELTASPRADGGFEVHARLPIGPAPALGVPSSTSVESVG